MTLFAKFASVGGATMASRVLGFVREAMIAAMLGAGPIADAFYAAFRFPNLFRRLLAEGAFNTAFIPLFSKELENGGKPAARQFAEQILSVLILVLLVLTAVAMTVMPWLVTTVIAPGFVDNPGKTDLTILLTRIMFPYLAAMSLVAMFSGILNAFRRYFLAAIVPVILNVIFIAILAFAWIQDADGGQLAVWMAWGVFVSGILQLFLLIQGLRGVGFAVSLKRPRLSAPVKRLLALAAPTAIAGGITQINLLVGQVIASAQDGAIAVMNLAERLIQLPLGVIGIAIGVVLLPELTRALAAGKDNEATNLQNRSLEFGLGLTLPAAAGLFVLALPLVTLLYERGAFDREDSVLTAEVLAMIALGLPSFVLIKVLQPSYFARENMRTPMWFSAINAITNIALSLYLFPKMGVVGIAIAGSVAGWINALLLYGGLARDGRLVLRSTTGRNLLLILVATLLMAVVLWLALGQLGETLDKAGFFLHLTLTLALVATGAVLYFAMVLTTGALPRAELAKALRRR